LSRDNLRGFFDPAFSEHRATFSALEEKSHEEAQSFLENAPRVTDFLPNVKGEVALNNRPPTRLRVKIFSASAVIYALD
jgi:hypothetical protein